MDLSLDHTGDHLHVRRTAARAITVNEHDYHASLVMTPTELIDHWPIRDARLLQETHAEPILALQPELVILGTGPGQVFPPAAFLACFLKGGIGIEVMDNAAAARTYDLLAAEGRKVAVAFILPAA